jgi:UDP-glucose 4-epimerase
MAFLSCLAEKKLLITGGTGSFGNAVLRKYLAKGVREIRIFSRDEKKQDEMRHKYRDDRVKYYIGDVRNPASIASALRGVDFVFHAAALKQVPSCEFYPMESVLTNVLGTHNVLTACIQEGVKRVVCLSTDKAVYPINAMGISKALMEKVAISESRNLDEAKTTIVVTRYGNVMASRGSVIPLFLDQIREGKALSVTEPAMTRFLMHLDVAVDLVEFAFEHGRTGDTFIRKSPAATIGDLALAIRELMNTDCPVNIIGSRHGEKLYETLLSKEEMVRAEDMGDFYRVPADSRDLNYSKYFTEGNPESLMADEYHSDNAERLDVARIKHLLLTLDCVQEAIAAKRQFQEAAVK